MGGVFTVMAYGEPGPKLDSAIGAALEEARRLDLLFSNYRQDSEWSRVNHEAARGPVKISSESFALL